jgi:hypothetical protein
LPDPANEVVDLVFGRFRGQVLYASTVLGVFDHLSNDRDVEAAELASMINADSSLLYRLLRALATIGLLSENENKAFRLTAAGALLRSDHPRSLRAMALVTQGPEAYAAWKHLVPIIRDGRPDGFRREFGVTIWDYAKANPAYRALFNQAMTSHSTVQTQLVTAALRSFDFSAISTICDVGGGHGHLVCGLLQAYPHLAGIVFDQPQVVAETDLLWGPKLGLADRCRYLGGDMFREVPPADLYTLKMILHDWSDDDCIRILSTIRRASSASVNLFIAGVVIPGPSEPHFAKLLDVHMMCMQSGRERTTNKYAGLLSAAG